MAIRYWYRDLFQLCQNFCCWYNIYVNAFSISIFMPDEFVLGNRFHKWNCNFIIGWNRVDSSWPPLIIINDSNPAPGTKSTGTCAVAISSKSRNVTTRIKKCNMEQTYHDSYITCTCRLHMYSIYKCILVARESNNIQYLEVGFVLHIE